MCGHSQASQHRYTAAASNTHGLQPAAAFVEAIGNRMKRNVVDAPDILLSGTSEDRCRRPDAPEECYCRIVTSMEGFQSAMIPLPWTVVSTVSQPWTRRGEVSTRSWLAVHLDRLGDDLLGANLYEIWTIS